jgi:hypothetical protein
MGLQHKGAVVLLALSVECQACFRVPQRVPNKHAAAAWIWLSHHERPLCMAPMHILHVVVLSAQLSVHIIPLFVCG